MGQPAAPSTAQGSALPWLTRAVALAIALLLSCFTVAGCSSGRSVAAYCHTFIEEGQKLRASWAGTNAASDPLGAFVQVLAAPQELALMFKKLQRVSPDDIVDDVEVLQKAFQKVADDAAANGANPLQGVLEAVVLGATTKGPADRVDAYTTTNCGPLPGAAAAATPSPSELATSASASPSATSASAAAPGDVLFDDSKAQELCGPGTIWNGDGHQTYDLKFVAGGRAAIDCRNGSHQVQVEDLLTGTTLWQVDLPDDSQWTVTSQHLFISTTEEVAATGLDDAYTKAELTAYTLSDGNVAWTVPLEDWIDNDKRKGGDLTVWEDTPNEDESAASVVVSYQATTAFDPDTGKERWHTKTHYLALDDPNANLADAKVYVGAGVYKTVGEASDGAERLEGHDARTGKRLWTLNPPLGTGYYGGGCIDKVLVEGTTLWCGHSSYYEKVDLLTGKLLERFALPKSESSVDSYNVWTSETGILVHEGSKLRYYTPASGDQPAWSVKAGGNVDALGLGKNHLLVLAASGPVMLSAADGSEEKTATTEADAGTEDGSAVVDGIAWMQTEFAGPVAVLLDPHQ